MEVERALIPAPEESATPLEVAASCRIKIQISHPMETRRTNSSWVFSRISFVLNVVLFTALAAILLPKIYQGNTDRRGLIGISGTTVEWIKSCPSDKYTASLSDLDTTILDYGVIQVGDEVWLCGGHGGRDQNLDQIKTCLILSLLDGRWRTFEHQMVHPRIKPVMFVDKNRVFVISGVTSDVNSDTGCRDTQEVINLHHLQLFIIFTVVGI